MKIRKCFQRFQYFQSFVWFGPAIGSVIFLLKARHEELIVWRIDECSLLLQTIYEVLHFGRKRKMRRCTSTSGWKYGSGSSGVAVKCANHYTMTHWIVPYSCLFIVILKHTTTNILHFFLGYSI